MFLDFILHYIWHNTKHSFTQYDELVEQIKFTSRQENNKVNNNRERQLLINITWIFHLDITIIGFRKSRQLLCSCQDHLNLKQYPFYIFQNPILSLTENCDKLIILSTNDNFYIYYSDNIQPLLINKPSKEHITFKNVLITHNHILDILQKSNLQLPFNVNIYSTYYYVKFTAVNQISGCLIGQFINENNKNTLNIFVTPHLQRKHFHLNTVMNIKLKRIFDPKFICSIKHVPEINKLYQRKLEKCEIDNKELLNQEHCICDHPSTTGIFLHPKHKMFRPLGE